MDVGEIVFDRYRVVAEIGRGGMAVVWRAHDEKFRDDVALKRVSFATIDDPDRWRARTIDEARNVRALSKHPEVITVHDVLDTADHVWLVLEYLPSVNLGELITREGTLAPAEVARIGAAVARALDGAHAAHMVHRDVKPANILVCDDGRVKLADFGISVVQDGAHYTRTGHLVGTVAWGSPEWARGEEINYASDIFSLGSTLFHALHGAPPFGLDANGNALLLRVATGNRNDVTATAGPLRDLIELMLQIEPIKRPNARYVAEQLQRIADLPQQVTRDLPPEVAPTNERSATQVEGDAAPPVPPPAAGGERRFRRLRRALRAVAAAPWRTRRRRTLSVVAVLVVAGLLAAVSLRPTSLTDLPTEVDQVALAVDQTTVDPCALTDVESLAGFGPARAGPGYILAGCEVRIGTAQGEARSFLGLFAVDKLSRISGKNRQQVGPLTIVRQGLGTRGCTNSILLPDQTYVRIDTDSYTDRARSIDICRVTEAVTAVAVNKLAASGTTAPADPGRADDYPLYRANACKALPRESLSAIPGLNTDAVAPGFGNWTCTWGLQNYGKSVVQLVFDRFRPDSLARLGDPTPTEAGTIYIKQAAGTYNKTQCSAYVQIRPPSSSAGLSEVVYVSADNTQPQQEQCQQVTALALAAKSSLPG